jgi:DNA recombination protein RmuC
MQRDYRVTLAGPTTLLAMLNSLHMGFRTLALEQQASEVWKVLGAVKTEFERYGDWVRASRSRCRRPPTRWTRPTPAPSRCGAR